MGNAVMDDAQGSRGANQVSGATRQLARPVAVALIAALAALMLAAAPAGAKKDSFNTKKLKNQVAKQLDAQGYDVKQVLPCRKQGPSKYRCEWRVEGNYTDGPTYSCRGFATYFVKQHSIR